MAREDGSLAGRSKRPPGGGAFAATVTPWPTNPFTGSAVVPGHSKGDVWYHIGPAGWSVHYIDAYGHEGIMGSYP